ncbi:DUF6088 family protein [Acidobacteriota bacterium]
MKSINNKIISRIYGHGRGWCFTLNHFHDLGSPEAVRVTLHRLEKKGTIRRLARGLYDYPKKHPKIGVLSPSPEKIVRALSRHNSIPLQPSGAYSANMLGLSEHVPAKIVYLTSGLTRTRPLKIGQQEIILKRANPRYLAAGKISSPIILALKHLGKQNISRHHIEHLKKSLNRRTKEQLRKGKLYGPNWMHPIIDEIVKDSNDKFRKTSPR